MFLKVKTSLARLVTILFEIITLKIREQLKHVTVIAENS